MPEVRAPRRCRRLAFLSAVAGPTLVVGTVLAPPAHAAPADDIRINEVVTTGSADVDVDTDADLLSVSGTARPRSRRPAAG
ncbi:hypothetical protein [Streptomyces noursei]|uniref:hypothetical protein n=1 Tax=Streptomyces noursei TaxID=1971 RepID=UPI00196599D3|nr:hypothetical protein [Streptomyces noursei]QRX97530.1 hypothetical protein JNO44_34630 [Streptomyces noursei]